MINTTINTLFITYLNHWALASHDGDHSLGVYTTLRLLSPDQPPPALGAPGVPAVTGAMITREAFRTLIHPRLQQERGVTDIYTETYIYDPVCS